ncbi:MAG: enolase [Candidatus Aenigmarchaeota archaeon]|nr:enolase [Candidatus Aenigmarchaeota archaeon]
MKVEKIKARKILASNVKFTLEIELQTSKGKVRSSVPLGTSKSKHEVFFHEVERALFVIKNVRRYFEKNEFEDQKDVDRTLRIIDKTENFKEIGGNVALGISSAFLKAFSLENSMEVYEYISHLYKLKPKIPKPLSNVIGGGKHGGGTDFQEFHLFPLHQQSFLESISKLSEFYWKIAKKLEKIDPLFSFGRNLESAWVTSLRLNKILELLSEFSDENWRIGIDVAASNLWNGKFYVYEKEGLRLITQEQISFLSTLLNSNPISYVEDPFEENDFVSFSTLKSLHPRKLICGDDLYATNLRRLKHGLEIKSTNSVLVKPNQIGTITDTIEFIRLAKKNGLKCIISHRSAETEDVLICHLGVGSGCDFAKVGIAGERTVKLNEFLRIEERLRGS